MPLFQPSVLKHYQKLQGSEAINRTYPRYNKYIVQDNE